MRLEWLKEIEFEDLLTNDTALVATYCGLDVLIKLWEELPSMNLFVSTKPLIEAKRRYIEKYYDGHNAKKLAKILSCAERFVYDVVSKRQNGRQGDGKDNNA